MLLWYKVANWTVSGFAVDARFLAAILYTAEELPRFPNYAVWVSKMTALGLSYPAASYAEW